MHALPLSLRVARKLPVGWGAALRLLARRDPRLKDFPIHLRGVAKPIYGDVGAYLFDILTRFGCIPWQSGLDRLLRDRISKGDLVFDIGANIGATSALLAEFTGDRGRVIAFEPAPSTFALLKNALRDFDNVTAVNAGMAASSGHMDLYLPAHHDVASFKSVKGGVPRSVPTTTLDEAADRFGNPQFLKVDVEGFEEEVFAGGVRVLRDIRPATAFEALTVADRDKSIATIRRLSGDSYNFFRIGKKGNLVDIGERGSRDYFAMPKLK